MREKSRRRCRVSSCSACSGFPPCWCSHYAMQSSSHRLPVRTSAKESSTLVFVFSFRRLFPIGDSAPAGRDWPSTLEHDEQQSSRSDHIKRAGLALSTREGKRGRGKRKDCVVQHGFDGLSAAERHRRVCSKTWQTRKSCRHVVDDGKRSINIRGGSRKNRCGAMVERRSVMRQEGSREAHADGE
jgi:hypothetical protein